MARKSRRVEQSAVAVSTKKEVLYQTALYARLSVEDNGHPGDSMESQLAFLKQYIRGCPALCLTHIFTEIKFANLIQSAGTKYLEKGRNKGFRYILHNGKPLFFCDKI